VEASTVMVSRAAGGWQAELETHGVVSARSLVALDKRVRGLVGAKAVVYQFHTGNDELDRLVKRVRAARAAVRRYEERTRRLTDQVVMLPSGVSQRDLGVLLGLSHRRVYQLVERQRRLAARQKTGESEGERSARLFLVRQEGRP
jgi:hypothetical protein